jgi:hypothetical protein
MNELFSPHALSQNDRHSPSAESQRGPHSESPIGDTERAAIPLADAETPISESRNPVARLPVLAKPSLDDDDFDWSINNEDVVLREQRASAIYWNTRGDLVLRQERYWDEQDDPFLVIGRNNVHDFIDRLCEVVGIQSFGRPNSSADSKGQ